MKLLYGVVEDVQIGSYYVRFLSEDKHSGQIYPKLASYIPQVGDKVAVIEDDGKILVQGKVD